MITSSHNLIPLIADAGTISPWLPAVTPDLVLQNGYQKNGYPAPPVAPASPAFGRCC